MPRLQRIFGIAVFTMLVVGGLGSCDFRCTCRTDVRNNTPYHLHLLGQYESHLYVPPGGLNSMSFDDFDDDAQLIVLIAPGQNESVRIDVPADCGYGGCRFIDIQWEDSPPALVFELLDCTYEPNEYLDAGG